MSGAAVPPGVLGALTAGSRLEMATATLLDLAHRGHLTVTRTRYGDPTSWEVAATGASDEPGRAEQVLLGVLGVDRGPARYPCLTRADADRVHDALVSDAARLGLARPDPVRRRRQRLVAAAVLVVALVAGAVLLGAGLRDPGPASTLVVLAVLTPLLALRRPRVHTTDTGRAAVRAGREVERRLVAGGSDVGPDDVATLTALGRVQGLTRVLHRRNEPLPPWLHDADPDPALPLRWLDVADLATEADPTRPTLPSSGGSGGGGS